MLEEGCEDNCPTVRVIGLGSFATSRVNSKETGWAGQGRTEQQKEEEEKEKGVREEEEEEAGEDSKKVSEQVGGVARGTPLGHCGQRGLSKGSE